MARKDFTLALLVPGGWLGGIVAGVVGLVGFVLYTLASPVLFIAALVYPGGPEDLFNDLFGD